MTKVVLMLLWPSLACAADAAGQWSLHLVRFGDEFAAARVELKTDGSKLTGTLNELKLSGSIDGDQLHITATRPNGEAWGKLEGRLQGDDVTGTVKRGDDEFAWKAHRITAISAEPKTHDFEPTKFQRTFSGAIAPVLRINPGDTIRTTTVDAGGRDAKNTPVRWAATPRPDRSSLKARCRETPSRSASYACA
jgi:hypothetical protein